MTLIFVGCSKKDEGFTPTLPPITQTGENTFGCYVNGVLITPRNGTGTFYGPDSGMYVAGSFGPHHDIRVHDFASDRTSSITIRIKYLDSLGVNTYIVNESGCSLSNIPSNNNIFCRVFDFEEGIYKTYCSFENSGIIEITRHDVDNNILSGTFSGKVRNMNDSNDIVEITNGRFDIKRLTVYNTVFP